MNEFEAVKRFILILVLLLGAGCKPKLASAFSSDGEMQHKLTGIWVHKRTLNSKRDIVATLEMLPDGNYTGIHTFSKALPDGVSRIETRGRWRIQNGFLIMTEISSSLTNAQSPEEVRVRIVRLDDRDLEYEPPDKIKGFSVPTNHIIFRRQPKQ